MADEPIIAPTVSAGEIASPAPVVVATPVAGAEPAVTPAESQTESVVITEGAPATDAPIQPERSLLGQLRDDKPPEPKVEEPKPEGEKPADAPKPEAAAPIVWEYTVPETVKLDDEGRTRVNGMFEAFVGNPRDKANQQALIDYHVEQMQAQAKLTSDFNRNFWAETRKEWREKIAGDEQLGGSGYRTTQAAIKRMMDLLVKPEHEREWEEFLEVSGAGDHPALHRLLHNAARFFDEPHSPPPNPNPPADIGKPPGRGRLRDRYQGMPG